MAAAVVAALSIQNAAGESRVEWLEGIHDFGAFDEDDGKVTCEFRFVNMGDEPVAVIAARPSCGCTVPSFPRQQIAPGDTASIGVTFDPTGRPGRFEKNVKVQLSAAETPNITLRIKGVVIGNANTLRGRYPVDAGVMKLRSSVVPFGEMTKLRSKAEFVEIYNSSGDTIVPEWVMVPKYMRVSVKSPAIPPGEQVAYALTIVPSETDVYGILTDSVAVRATESSKPVVLDVVANINEDFSRLTPGQRQNAPRAVIEERSVDFGRLSRGEVVEREFKITNRGKDELKIRRVYTADRGVTVSVDRTGVKKGKSATVKVRVDTGELPSELLNARIAVVTNDPEDPTQIVRAVGEVE